jgi:ribosomal protein S18 acetylase RimI-like enzyme
MSEASSASVDITPPTVADVEAITRLFLNDMRDLGEHPDPAALQGVATHMVEHNGAGIHVFVARVDGSVGGVVVANEFQSIKFPGRALWIEELYVDPGFRRHGIGRKLVDALLHHAWKLGIQGVELEAYRMNTAASVLYRSIGFKRLARERYSIRMDEFDWGE